MERKPSRRLSDVILSRMADMKIRDPPFGVGRLVGREQSVFLIIAEIFPADPAALFGA